MNASQTVIPCCCADPHETLDAGAARETASPGAAPRTPGCCCGSACGCGSDCECPPAGCSGEQG